MWPWKVEKTSLAQLLSLDKLTKSSVFYLQAAFKKDHLHYVMKQTKFFFLKVFRNEEMAQQNFLANPKVEQYFLPSFS